jgi:putative heme-binding domain-containing protein
MNDTRSPAVFGLFLLIAAALAWTIKPTNERAPASNRAASRPTASPEESATDSALTLPRRTPWTTSRVVGTPEPPPPFRTSRLFPKLAFKHPVVISFAPGSNRIFVGEQEGKVWSFPNDPEVEKPDLFLDTRQIIKTNPGNENVKGLEALYGLTFHPDFARNRFCYVCYVVSGEDRRQDHRLPDGTRVSRFKVSDTDPPRAIPESEQIVITWLQGGHNGGCLHFGPKDGCLYISTGDGGNAFPPDGLNAGQDLSHLLSKVLRIDVDHPADGLAYSIPPDNPFVNQPGMRGETWCFGLRNPWKIGFDRETGDLWVGDVGWELWELVYRVQKGGNYGWSVVEGPQQVHPERKTGPTPILPATVEIPHTDGVSVTGGYVYRGKKFPELLGTYLFGDWETRRVWGVKWDGEKATPRVDLVDPTVRLVAFCEDPDGELWLLDYDDGSIHELVHNEARDANQSFPTRLSETGLFASVPDHQPAPGVVPFSINSEQWTDGATAERFVAIPGDGVITLHKQKQAVAGSMFQSSADWPKDSVLVKTLSLEMERGPTTGWPGSNEVSPRKRRRIETQLLHFDGRFWRAYSYRWNDDQTDADLVDIRGAEVELTVREGEAPAEPGSIDNRRANDGSAGASPSPRIATDVSSAPQAMSPSIAHKQTWHFSSRVECARCHNQWVEYALAFNLRQLNYVILGCIPPDCPPGKKAGFGGGNQLTLLREIGLLALPDFPARDDSGIDRFYDSLENPYTSNPATDTSARLNGRARSWLHVNCAHCHRNGGGGSAYIELQAELAIEATKALDVRPTQGTFGIADAKILAPGDPYRSTLFYRISKTGSGRMPHIGSEVVDERGVQLIHDWIRQLPVRTPEVALIERLRSLDETTAIQQEDKDRRSRLQNLAQQQANDRRAAEREMSGTRAPNDDRPADITEADRAVAAELDKTQTTERIAARIQGRTDTINELLAKVSTALLLSRAVQEGRLPDGVREQVVTAATAHSDPAVRDLFERFLPDDKRPKRLGSVINVAALLATPGDADRGRNLFFNTSNIQCKNCHVIAGTGGKLGPDLSQIGKKYNRAQLLESILEPSKFIEPKYITRLVETTSGKVFTGILVEQTDREVVLRDVKDQLISIPANEVELVVPQRQSIMPDLQLRDMTAEQVADLLEFLVGLK